MGQAGSQEQRASIRDVINLKPSTEPLDKETIVTTLQAFCKTFPLEVSGNSVYVSE